MRVPLTTRGLQPRRSKALRSCPLSYMPMVAEAGFEPATSPLSVVRSTGLSYSATNLVGNPGFEPGV